MVIRIRWHRQWANFPISGLCEKDGTPYWFHLNIDNKTYTAYSLTLEKLDELDEELKELIDSYGSVIFHDERYFPELPTGGGSISKLVKTTSIELSKVAFSFEFSDFSNPIPHQEYYAAKRGTTL